MFRTDPSLRLYISTDFWKHFRKCEIRRPKQALKICFLLFTIILITVVWINSIKIIFSKESNEMITKYIGFNVYNIEKMAKLNLCPLCFGDDPCDFKTFGHVRRASTMGRNATVSGYVHDTADYYDLRATSYLIGQYNGKNVTIRELVHEDEIDTYFNHVFSKVWAEKCGKFNKKTLCRQLGDAKKKLDMVMISKNVHIANYNKDFGDLNKVNELWMSSPDIYNAKNKYRFHHCLSESFFKTTRELFHIEIDSFQNKSLNFYTNFITTPELIIRKFAITQLQNNDNFSKIVKVCGNILVSEDQERPLGSLDVTQLNWKIRAEIAYNLLTMVDTLINGDPNWLIFLSDISYSTFSIVNNTGNTVRLNDFRDVLILDKMETKPFDEEFIPQDGCNADCFQTIRYKFFKIDDRAERCSLLTTHADMMFSLLVKNVLSPYSRHVPNYAENEMNIDKHGNRKRLRKEVGLLHGIPKKVYKIRYLMNSIEEEEKREPYARLKVVDELKTVLKESLSLAENEIKNCLDHA